MFLDEMNYLQVEAYLKVHDTVLIPVGSIENHGKHMPLGTDTLIPGRLAQRINELLGDDIVIAPALPYGATQDLASFPGTVNIGIDGLEMILSRICLQLQGHGFRRFIILNGHGGNCKSIECTGMKLYEKGCLLCRVDWWILAGQLNEAWRGGHGGAEEARGVMAWDEDLIKKEHLYTGESTQNDLGDELPYASWTAVSFDGGTVTVPRPVRSFTDNGWLAHGIENDEPFKATPEEGRKMLTRVAKYVADLCGVFGKAPLPAAEKE